jgi:hypothetical protein
MMGIYAECLRCPFVTAVNGGARARKFQQALHILLKNQDPVATEVTFLAFLGARSAEPRAFAESNLSLKSKTPAVVETSQTAYQVCRTEKAFEVTNKNFTFTVMYLHCTRFELACRIGLRMLA